MDSDNDRTPQYTSIGFAFEAGEINKSLPTNVMEFLSTWKVPRDPPCSSMACVSVCASSLEVGATVSLYSKLYVTMMDPHLKET